jgi:transposase
MTNWIMYGKIQEYKRNGLNKSQVQRRLALDYKTILKYWDMSPDEFAANKVNAENRTRKADPYKDYVIECLRKYPDMSAAQVYDWIKERMNLKELTFKERAFRNYVRHIRKEYDIKKPDTTRQYEAVDELPMGKQAQVDMGEIILETTTGRHKKVYCFAMVLSCSRYKFILWQEKPFTTDSFIRAHIKAFTFYGGRPLEIVYDQDKILAVSENNGDIIYTEGFQNYVNNVKFNIFLCHGADPESKGKIENVVRYAKHGFAEHRTFKDIYNFNEDCIAWLDRTANAKIHDTTKRIPAEIFALEREHLIPVSEYSFEKAVNASISYQVRKDNLVLYKSNRYRVPKGTYAKGKRVYMMLADGVVSIVDTETGEIYATHPLCTGKGQLVGQRRDERDNSKSLMELEDNVKNLFDNQSGVSEFLNQIHQEKKRYYRDQLGVIKKLFEKWDKQLIFKALPYCMERNLYSAGELKSCVIYLDGTKKEQKAADNKLHALPSKYRGNAPDIRDLRDYEEAMNRRVACE